MPAGGTPEDENVGAIRASADAQAPPTFFYLLYSFSGSSSLKLTFHAVAEDNTKRNADFDTCCLVSPEGSS